MTATKLESKLTLQFRSYFPKRKVVSKVSIKPRSHMPNIFSNMVFSVRKQKTSIGELQTFMGVSSIQVYCKSHVNLLDQACRQYVYYVCISKLPKVTIIHSLNNSLGYPVETQDR